MSDDLRQKRVFAIARVMAGLRDDDTTSELLDSQIANAERYLDAAFKAAPWVEQTTEGELVELAQDRQIETNIWREWHRLAEEECDRLHAELEKERNDRRERQEHFDQVCAEVASLKALLEEAKEALGLDRLERREGGS